MSERGAQPRVFTIAPDAPFLPTLVEAILDGTAVPSFRLDDDPLALADMRIFVPTRRAARELREVFVAKLGGRAAILPRITPIGDVDEESYLDEATLADEDALPPNISDLERRLVVTRLVTSWSRRVGQDLAHPTGATEIGIPASPADAARLADDLIRLMDQVATERADWRKLVDLVPGDYALYWQLSLEFLKIVTEHWPAYLAERGLADPGARRDAAIERTARRLQAAPPTTPVIAAGSTGSAPATASLLAAIAKLPTGAVVLPGLDLDLAEDAWQAIGDRDTETATPSHPQYGMRQLIARIGIDRADVGLLGGHPSPARARRSHIVNEALRPADVTDGWRLNTLPTPAEAQAAFEDVALIKAANEEEEALAIAIALREAIAEDQTAALVTPDRLLARRVARQLLRWNIRVDDSAGRPLATTPPAILARLVAETVLDGFEPQTLLAILKHPLARLGLPRPSLLRAARNLEIAVLRGPRAGKGSDGLCAAIEAVQAALARGDGYPHPAARALSTDDWAGIRDLGRRLQEAFAPLEALASAGDPVPVTELAAAHVATFERATRDEAGQLAQLTDPAAGRRLADFLTGFFAADAAGFSVAPGDWPALFGALLDGIAVRPAIPTDPRIFIWGPLEARLQSVDRLVLGGLSEGVWPAATRSDPWLSRPMRRDLGLEAPERRIGLSAHDFAQGLGAPRVVLTHPLRKDGAPTVDSRWLQRLSAVLGPDESTRITARGDRYLQLARTLDGAGGEAAPAPRPEPRPPVSSRPTSLSVTEIETLIRDPYAIYARHILRLEPLDDLGAAPDLAERGTILHAIFAAFIRARAAGDRSTG